MDTFAHGLWGGVAFGRRGWRYFLFATLLGMAPDLLTFGPRFFGWALAGFPDYPIEPGTTGAPALASLSAHVFTAYNITHSLIVWTAAFICLYLIAKKPPWLFCAWGLHILCDIPTHTTRYFPTPFLWPFETPYVDGIHWAQPWFLIPNYLFLVGMLAWIVWRAKKS